jgi:hypothetical protein
VRLIMVVPLKRHKRFNVVARADSIEFGRDSPLPTLKRPTGATDRSDG